MTTTATVTVQQVVFTRDAQRWHTLAEVLGLAAPFAPSPEWGEFDGDGVLAVHHSAAGADRVELNVLVRDLDAAEKALAGHDVAPGEMAGVGRMLTVRTRAGVELAVFAGARATAGEVAVQPIWFQDDIAEARAVLEALGMRAEIAADAGGWVQLRADGGGTVGLHSASGRSEGDGAGFGLSFEARGDLDALAARLRAAGFDASVVDEAYTRTIRIAEPAVTVNAAQTDLHGYHREA